jgi:hypothetical protein
MTARSHRRDAAFSRVVCSCEPIIVCSTRTRLVKVFVKSCAFGRFRWAGDRYDAFRRLRIVPGRAGDRGPCRTRRAPRTARHRSRTSERRTRLPDCPVRVHGWRTQIRPGMALLDEIGELVRVAHEEHRRIVADQIPVAFLGVELDGEAAHVAFGIGCAEIRVPCAPQPLACTERSGMRSRTSERARGVGVPDVSERIT